MTNASAPTGHPVSLSFKDFRDGEIVEFFANESRSFGSPSNSGGHFSRSRVVGAPHFKKAFGKKESGREEASSKGPATDRKPTAAFRSSIRFFDGPTAQGLEGEETIPLPDDSTDDGIAIRVARFQDFVKRKRKASVEPSFGKPTRPLGSLLQFGRTLPSNNENRAARIVRDPLEKSRSRSGEKKASGAKKQIQAPSPSSNVKIEKKRAVASVSPCKAPIDPVERASEVETPILDRLRETDDRLQQLIDSWPVLSPQLKETIATLVAISEKSLSDGT